jgi:hypothetical protein
MLLGAVPSSRYGPLSIHLLAGRRGFGRNGKSGAGGTVRQRRWSASC